MVSNNCRNLADTLIKAVADGQPDIVRRHLRFMGPEALAEAATEALATLATANPRTGTYFNTAPEGA